MKRRPNLNHGPALYNLGVMHEEGMAGLAKDPAKAMEFYVSAGERGEPLSQNRLGVWYRSGEGPVLKDNVAAAAWFGMAAATGYAAAQVNLGLMYEEGAGVPRDFGKAGNFTNSPPPRATASACSSWGDSSNSASAHPRTRSAPLVLYEQAALVHPPAAEARDALKKKLTAEQTKQAKEALEKLRARRTSKKK